MLRNNKKVLLLLIAIVISVLTTVEPKAFAEKVTIRVANWGPRDLCPVWNILQRLMEDHPNIKVEFEYHEDHFDKLIMGLVTGQAPDIFLWWDFPGLIEEGFAEDLTPYLEKSEVLSEDIFFPGVLLYGGKYKDGIYALPHSFTSRVILYNKDNFDEFGVAYPDGSWTWDEFRGIARKLTAPEKQTYGFDFYHGVYNIGTYTWSNGGSFMNLEADQALGYCDSPETIEAVEWLASLKLDDGVMPPPGSLSAGQGFAFGNIAMIDTGSWDISVSKQANPALRLASALPPHPEGKQLQTVLHSSGWVLNGACKHKDEALTVLEYLAGPIGQAEMVRQEWALPTIPSVATDFQLWLSEEQGACLEAAQYAMTPHYFLRTPLWHLYYQSVVQNALDEVFEGRSAGHTALTSAARQLQDLLDYYNKE
ncbi:MAG: sugar ABC transporter substrate-binding protein [Limnochordia bacterium]|nr:sugar ABC transporter substrate-binding protein [Limnochordia bacterium]